jgi:hypothetical protein
MQKIFLISFIIFSLALPVRRARREQPFPISKVITDFMIFLAFFALILRFGFGKLA